MTATMAGQFLLVILKETTQGGCSIFCRIPELEITDELVDSTPYAYRFRLGSPGCLVFYPDIILADIGDVEAAVVSKRTRRWRSFLPFFLICFTTPTQPFQRSVEDADGIILEDEIIIPLIYDAQSLDIFSYLLIIIDEALHIRIRDAGEVDNLVQGVILSICAEQSSLGKEGTLYRFPGFDIKVIATILEIAVMGKDALQCFLIFYPDKEETERMGTKRTLLATIFGRNGLPTQRKVIVGDGFG